MTTDDLDKIAKTAVSFKNIKNKKLKISTPKKIQSTKDIKSKSSRKSPRKLKRCVAVTTNIHNKSIADNYKKKSKRILTEHNTPITKKKNSKSQHKIIRSMTLDDLDSDLSYTTSPYESEIIETYDQKTAQHPVINSQIIILTEEKEQLQKEVDTLKNEIFELKRSNEMKKLMKKLKVQKLQADNAAIVQQMNTNHKCEINVMQLTIDSLQFEQKKLKSELDHENKLHEQKVNIFEADINAKKAVNEQLRMFQETVDKQLLEQTKITNKIMKELEEVRKNEYIRVPRNNNNVGMRCGNSVSGGCCSSWLGRNRNNMENNMYIKLREGSTIDHDSSND
eukprot:18337_1